MSIQKESVYKVGDKVLFNIYHKKKLYEGDSNSIKVTDYCETQCGIITKIIITETEFGKTFEYEVDNRNYIINEKYILTKISSYGFSQD